MSGIALLARQAMDAVTAWIVGHPTGRWVFFGGAVGLLCGLASACFEVGTDMVSRLLLERLSGLPPIIAASHPAELHLSGAISLVALLGVMAGGGLLAGLIIMRWSPSARGGGTGVAVHAFHSERGVIPLATPWTKLVASIVSLGSGGSGGREGPISLIGAGFGSWFAGRMRLSPRDRRILLVAGIAGGIAAVFRAPLAASIEYNTTSLRHIPRIRRLRSSIPDVLRQGGSASQAIQVIHSPGHRPLVANQQAELSGPGDGSVEQASLQQTPRRAVQDDYDCQGSWPNDGFARISQNRP